MYRTHFLLFVILAAGAIPLKAQNDLVVKDTVIKPKKPLMLSFGLDLNVKGVSAGYDHNYTGEYNENGSGPGGWEWVSHNASYTNLLKYGPFTDVKISVLAANSKKFQLGLSYNFGGATIPTTAFDADGKAASYPSDPQSIVYSGISLMTEYNYYFNKTTYLGTYVFGGIDLGFYTGTDNVFGTGTPWYLQGRLGAGYNFKHDILVKAFLSSDHLIYHESETSQVYQRPETLNINLDAFYIGLGISKTFTLLPD